MKSARKSKSVDGLAFTAAVTAISRSLILRDKLLQRTSKARLKSYSNVAASRHTIASGNETLDAVFVAPAAEPARAALLICHGIGETVEHWSGAQKLLAEHAVSSLVFDYCGYGRSTGSISWQQCEEDAVAAFGFLKKLASDLPASVLGFSMGSGIAAAVLDRIAPRHLILGSAFTSFRAAARSVGLPRPLSSAAPSIWNTRESLRRCSVPVLILHCEKDRVFPTRMAAELASCCGARATLVIVTNHRHNEPFYRPRLSYWGHVVSRLVP